MNGKHKHPKTLQEAVIYFSDPDNALDYMVHLRWPNGVVTCPTCGRTDVVFLKNQRKWQCKLTHPKRQFSAKVGTVFEDSPIPLEKWVVAVWMLANCKNGVSSYEIARTIGVTQKSAWFMLHRIRFAMKAGLTGKLGGNGGGVESDETYIGGNPLRMHKSRRVKINSIMANTYGVNKYAAGKTTVHGMIDRETREVRASVIPNVKRATLQEKILNNVAHGATVYTDELPSYKYALAEKFIHEVVNHSQEYVNGQVHTNCIENFWSLLKRGIRGTYVAVEPFHLDRYLDEQVFRFNTRKDGKRIITDRERFDLVLSKITGKRLTYAEVTGKVGTTPF